ncbi:enoyl-CoA hydratase-related protein [Nocardia vinacea]|uniref:enoyl-CoA hydratase-related protein n=1 Tax=Nocardia vinacea TaxID=96468 RepID=UPI0002E09C8E|nr:enoyl-CoA hydratase-related protein [Nocardia vinacea]
MSQRVLLLCSAENGLTRRAAAALRRAGRVVRTEVVAGSGEMDAAVAPADFDLIICPYLKYAVPEHITSRWTTLTIHPGPVGDRGPHSLDWAITNAEPRWGVTALTAVFEMDAGPVWAFRTFPLPRGFTKSAIYNTVVADAAVECILEASDKASDPRYVPVDQTDAPREVRGARPRSAMRQSDRAIDWAGDAHTIARRINAADGSPGVLTTLHTHPVYVHDAHPGKRIGRIGEPGTIVSRAYRRIEIACGTGTLWIGHLGAKTASDGCKGPATNVLRRIGYPILTVPQNTAATYRDIHYRREGSSPIATITIDAYNGAFDTSFCLRLADAIRFAGRQGTDVLVVRGTESNPHWCNGIHLGAIEHADDPAREGWANITAINAVCRALLECTSQVTVAALTGSAGAGGAMLALAADVVVARQRVLLNPHYATLGLTGSELHTFTLPRRVGSDRARELLTECPSLDTVEAHRANLIDHVGPDREFDCWLDDLVREYCRPTVRAAAMRAKYARLNVDLPPGRIDAILTEELAQMSADLFGDRHGFAARRHAFLRKIPQPASVRGHLEA